MTACFISDIVVSRRSLRSYSSESDTIDNRPKLALTHDKMSNDSLSSSRLFNATSVFLHCIRVAAGDVSSEARG
jgi:hypothetical protein